MGIFFYTEEPPDSLTFLHPLSLVAVGVMLYKSDGRVSCFG